MGLLKAGVGALGGALADQWREYFYCEAMSADVLATKGAKRTSARSSNTKGESDIITNGSIVAVNDGQCMMIVEQGKVVELSAEPGEYVWDSSTEPSIFYGGLGKGLLDTFKQIGKRFTFGGDTGKDQRVYFINTKEIIGNKYGTANPVPFRVVDTNIGLDMDIGIRCFGEYSYKIIDPMLFYTNVCGNIRAAYTRDQIDSQLKTELLTALQPAFAQISTLGIRYSALPGHTMELADALNQVLSGKWAELRGVRVISFGVSSVTANPEDEATIKELQKSGTLRNPTMAAAHLVGAQADAMKAAASNQGSGAFMAFAGMNAAQGVGGANAQNLFQMGQQAGQQPAAAGWNCAKCGAQGNTGKFCAECGAPKPAGVPQYKCDKCGWEPADKAHPPKFCPECGDPFDDGDLQG
ncbi:MAG: SPFH domain-containing protein [Christensenellaceae bacterium]|jgi:membrane protease subunit (stomatin/prohibitin family)|nr:SPFH domain-containing protein [Christensenellaceae bacterium]